MKKRIVKLLIASLPLLFTACESILQTEPKPADAERGTEYIIVLKDYSGLMQGICGSDRVGSAAVTLKSNTLGIEYKAVSDSNGIVRFKGIASDYYHLSAIRELTPEEMNRAAGQSLSGYKLINKGNSVFGLFADHKEQQEVRMEAVSGGSGLIISEIYASGPKGSGLYFHDKYVEIYNQSDSVIYLDNVLIAIPYQNNNTGQNYITDDKFIHSHTIWYFPGEGRDTPILPGQFIVCAEDAIDHRINAPGSVDLSKVDFEFYKDDAPDLDNTAVPNMVRFIQNAGNDWLIGGESDALVLARIHMNDLTMDGEMYLIPMSAVIDGVEYLKDPTKLEKKKLNKNVDAGAAGGIQFYTGKSMERNRVNVGGKIKFMDNNNSTLDFSIISPPSPNK